MAHSVVHAGLFPVVSMYPVVCGRSFSGHGKARPLRATPSNAYRIPLSLESQLQCKLQQTRITHLLRLAESRVRGVAVHTVELRVVKHVENLRAELHPHLFVNWRHLEQTHVPVIDRRITAQRARRITKRSQRHAIIVQLPGIENETVGARIVGLEWSNQVWLPWAFKTKRAS